MSRDEVITELAGRYDGVIFAQNHREFADIELANFIDETGIIYDLK